LSSADILLVWPIRQRLCAQALLQRLQLVRRQQALPRRLPLEAQALVAQASRRAEWARGLVPRPARRHQQPRHVHPRCVGPLFWRIEREADWEQSWQSSHISSSRP
jgi:hypothetical protein